MNDPFIDVQCPLCAGGTACSLFIEIFGNLEITEANKKNKMLPKYGFHLGAICPQCGTRIKHLQQPKEIVGKKFILIP